MDGLLNINAKKEKQTVREYHGCDVIEVINGALLVMC